MKNRILSLLLVLSFCLPVFAFGTLPTRAEETEGPAPMDDTVMFSNADNNTSASSGASTNRWNKLQPGSSVAMTKVKDPTDAGVEVTRVMGKVASCTLMRSFIPGTRSSVFDASFYMLGEGGQYMDSLQIKLAGNLMIKLTYNAASGRYDLTDPTGALLGTIAPDTWFSTSLSIDVTAGTTADLTMTVGGGDLRDAAGRAIGPQTVTVKGKTLAEEKNEWVVSYGTASGAERYFLIKGARHFVPGDFLVGSPRVPYDAAGYPVVWGQITLSLNHVPVTEDLAGAVTLCRADGATVPVTAVSFAAETGSLVLDFSHHPLSEDTSYILSLDGLRDGYGHAPFYSSYTFDTRVRQAGEEEEEEPVNPAGLPDRQDPLLLPEYGYVMPDRYNTGYRCAYEELVPWATKYPEAASGVITDGVAAKYNYDFSGFTLIGGISNKCTVPICIHDCYIEGNTWYSVQNLGTGRLTVEYAELCGSKAAIVNGSNVTVRHCYLHDGSADLVKGGSNQLYESNYLRDGGTRSPGAHADGIQYSGSSSAFVNNSRVMGNRFDMPNLCYDHVANCCFFFKPESDIMGFANIQGSGNWFNGGGYTTYLTPACPLDRIWYITYTGNHTGWGYTFGPHIFGQYNNADGFASYNGNDYQGNDMISTLQAGSVVYYASSGDTRTRVYDVSEAASGEMTVLVNFANYTWEGRTYTIRVRITDAEGREVGTGTAEGRIIAYTPAASKEKNNYITGNTELARDENGELITYTDGNGTHTVNRLIELPTLPSDVEATVTLTGLPTDLSGCTVSVTVYDTTSGSEMIRSSTLTDCVTENRELYDSLPEHTVTFVGINVAGQPVTLGTQTVTHGQSATLPEVPEVDGYMFLGWDMLGTSITADTVLTARYASCCTLQFFGADGTLIETLRLAAGDKVEAPAAPIVQGYVFTGWDRTVPATARGDGTFTALYARINTVTFRDADGRILSVQRVQDGHDATPPAAPQKDGFTFAGWEGSYTAVTADTTVTARYEGLVTVTFLGWDGIVLSTQAVAAGTPATPPSEVPGADRSFFVGWDTADYLAPTQSITVRARFATGYRVTFAYTDGTVLAVRSTEDGAIVPPTPDQNRGGKTFSAWSRDIPETLTEDMTVTALYGQVVTVTYLDGTGHTLAAVRAEKGSDVTAPADPARAGYRFAGWDKETAAVTADTTVTARWQKVWTVTFRASEGGAVLAAVTVDEGSAATPPATPAREGYRFVGWSASAQNVTADLTVTAQWQKVWTVTFRGPLGILASLTVDDGSAAVAPAEIPEISGYIFRGWDASFDRIGSDLTVTAEYAPTAATSAYLEALAGVRDTLSDDTLTTAWAALSRAVAAWQKLDDGIRAEKRDELQACVDAYNARVEAVNGIAAEAEAARVR